MKEFENSCGFSERTQALVDELLNDSDVLTLMEKRGFSEEDVKRNIITFIDWKQHIGICKGCTGLKQCGSESIGYYYNVNKDFNVSLAPCKYLKENNEKLSHKKNYLICDVSEKNLTTSLSTIDLSKESSYYKSIVEALMEWEEEKNEHGYYIHGGIGVGKTYLAAAVCNDLARAGKKVAFVNFPRLATDIRNNISEKNYVDDKLRKMRTAYLLVLDDVGAENMSGYIRDDILFTILDYRMENGKPTIFTSNCTIERLASRWSSIKNSEEDQLKAARLIERIKASINCELPINGSSRRVL